VGLEVEQFDLQKYFRKHSQLNINRDIRKYGVIWVSGGNVFVLRQAMKLSSFNKILGSVNNIV